jgi:hypothetical protein
MKRYFFWLFGWCFVRPQRWLFRRMVFSTHLQLLPQHDDYFGWTWPNPHWWILYKTVFRFFNWLHWDAWRPLCTWGERCLEHKPWWASLVQRIGGTTAGFAISGGECFHCASLDGNQVDLSDDETGQTFRLEEKWSVGTQDGTDYRFRGTTICPVCGYEAEYEDGSL